MIRLKVKAKYFSGPGDHTSETLELVSKFAEERGIKDVVVASTTGQTGALAMPALKGLNVVVVTHAAGFREAGQQELTEENRKAIEKQGGRIVTGTHALSSMERAFRKKFNTILPLEIIANTLRMFGEGTKVAVEIALMASDSGAIPVDRDVISIAGTGNGADTALLLRPSYSHRALDLKIRECICKPWDF